MEAKLTTLVDICVKHDQLYLSICSQRDHFVTAWLHVVKMVFEDFVFLLQVLRTLPLGFSLLHGTRFPISRYETIWLLVCFLPWYNPMLEMQ